MKRKSTIGKMMCLNKEILINKEREEHRDKRHTPSEFKAAWSPMTLSESNRIYLLKRSRKEN